MTISPSLVTSVEEVTAFLHSVETTKYWLFPLSRYCLLSLVIFRSPTIAIETSIGLWTLFSSNTEVIADFIFLRLILYLLQHI